MKSMAAAQPFSLSSHSTRGCFSRPKHWSPSSISHVRGKQVVPCGKQWHGVGFVPGAVFQEVKEVCFSSQLHRSGISPNLKQIVQVRTMIPDKWKLNDSVHSVATFVDPCGRPLAVASKVLVRSFTTFSIPARSGTFWTSSLCLRCAQTGIRVRANVGRSGGRSSKSPDPDEPPELELQPILDPEEYDFKEFAELDELEEFLDLELESDAYTETPRHYEIMFLIHERNVDEVQLVIEKVRDFIRDNKGVIHRLNDWGMRHLAYTIKKASKANYVLMNIEIGSQAINDLNSLFQKDDRVIRHMVMSQKIAITADSVPPEEYPYPSSRNPSSDDEDFDEADDDEYDEDEDEEEEQPELLLQRE